MDLNVQPNSKYSKYNKEKIDLDSYRKPSYHVVVGVESDAGSGTKSQAPLESGSFVKFWWLSWWPEVESTGSCYSEKGKWKVIWMLFADAS